MANTSNELNKARINKKDEFYTQYEDIELEMNHYKNYFKGKKVYVNCDDPKSSQFYAYFYNEFKNLELKELVSTYWVEEGKSLLTITNDGENIEQTELKGDGDFRSDECKSILDNIDVVITNPPFSLFRDLITLLRDKHKDFIILGNINAVTTNVVWDMIKNKELWLGKTIHSGDRKFTVPDDYPLEASGCGIDENGKKYVRVKGVRWFTNILADDTNNSTLELINSYDKEKYPTYENYDAIEVSKTKDIPYDYDGYMGVPITFLDKYNSNQFGIIDMDKNLTENHKRFYLNGKQLYARIVIKRK